jgi:CheY-like chemotaxis protein
MDVQMPEMDGIEATKQIRSGKSGAVNPDIPIIALTAHAMIGDKEACLKAGMNDYVSKPINPEELIASVQRLVRKQPVSAHLQTPPISPDEKRPESSGIFNMKELSDRIGGDPDVFNEIIHDLPGYLNQLINDLKHALDADNTEQIRMITHSIKGMAGNCAAGRLQDAARDMENAVKTGNMPPLADLYDNLKQERDALLSALAEHIRGRSDKSV